MKNKTYLITGLLLIILSISAFKNSNSPIEIIRKKDAERFENFKQKIQFLKSEIIKFENKTTPFKASETAFLELRKAYKSWEYLAEHYDAVFIKENINGAPLPKLEQNSFGANVIEPKGLQVLDELLFDDSAEYLTKDMHFQLDYMTKQLNELALPEIYSRDIFIAARIELIRIATTGLTGFDTPGSGNGIQDALSVFETMQSDLILFQSEIELKNKLLSDSIFETLNKSITYLKQNNNFETFNRYSFLTQVINPLFRQLLSAHLTLELELPSEINNKPQAFNYLSNNLFAPDFLNADYYINVPKQFINEDAKKLGQLLFFDPILSANNQRSCASCHNPEKGFTDQLPKSLAYNFEGNLKRNSPTLINCVYSDRYFHDLRAHDLTGQLEHVITNGSEFNSNWNDILDKLNQSSEYKTLYSKAFNLDTSNAISIQNTQFAMSVFVGSIVGFNSKFDQLIVGSQKTFNKSETDIIAGFNLFMGKAACGTCHFAPVFNGSVPPFYTESESEVLGVSENPHQKKQVLGADKGRGGALLKEQVPFYEYSFKTPTVRNIAISKPYMHNGAYKTLNETMTFYNNGGGAGIGIDLEFQTLGTDKLELSKKEIKQIIAFMESMTDTNSISSKPLKLPVINNSTLNTRKVGGEY
ncbi:MAG: cytochrome c peroxidase [Bacteroidota bacterium]|nr:cytochrome c peroxidase [Bacteroidota bacterium]